MDPLAQSVSYMHSSFGHDRRHVLELHVHCFELAIFKRLVQNSTYINRPRVPPPFDLSYPGGGGRIFANRVYKREGLSQLPYRKGLGKTVIWLSKKAFPNMYFPQDKCMCLELGAKPPGINLC